MSDEYPTDDELKTIKEWDILKKPITELLDYVHKIWWAPDWGWGQTGKKVIKLQLHTGGWSGNEDIIAALQSNFLFWSLTWDMTRKGGHYYFTIRLNQIGKQW